jgi:hypothetical protein
VIDDMLPEQTKIEELKLKFTIYNQVFDVLPGTIVVANPLLKLTISRYTCTKPVAGF